MAAAAVDLEVGRVLEVGGRGRGNRGRRSEGSGKGRRRLRWRRSRTTAIRGESGRARSEEGEYIQEGIYEWTKGQFEKETAKEGGRIWEIMGPTST